MISLLILPGGIALFAIVVTAMDFIAERQDRRKKQSR